MARTTVDSAEPVRRVFALRRMAGTFLYSYIVVLLLVLTVQAVCLFLDWRPPQAWVSFFSRFATSPAIAGMFALFAAVIGARSLAKQLAHTKEKAAYEAWWQQFEWVTDRIIPSGENTVLLPLSLAFDLMTSLLASATVNFQHDAVDGILKHYLKDFPAKLESDGDEEVTPSSSGPSMDAASASSLRNLSKWLPESASSTANVHRLLEAYDYEREVVNALRHRFGDRISFEVKGSVRPDAIIRFGNQKIIVQAKLSTFNRNTSESALRQVFRRMEKFGGHYGIVIIPRTIETKNNVYMVKDNIAVIGWNPSDMSAALQDSIESAISVLNP